MCYVYSKGIKIWSWLLLILMIRYVSIFIDFGLIFEIFVVFMNINICNFIFNKGKLIYFSYNMIYENKVNVDVYICMCRY